MLLEEEVLGTFLGGGIECASPATGATKVKGSMGAHVSEFCSGNDGLDHSN